MLSFEDGFAAIMALADPVGSEILPIEKAVGRVLHEDVIAKRPQPPFRNSAMDGYAIAGSYKTYELVGEVAAGAQQFDEIQDGQAVRIFTGAPLPKGADRILIQENALVSGQMISCENIPKFNDHIRALGQDFDSGFELSKGLVLTPETIALLAAMNCSNVQVNRTIKVAIIATGDELVSPDQIALPHQIIASNGYGISALLSKWGVHADILPIIKDDLSEITKALKKTENYDIIVTTGGASVGDYDFTAKAAENAGFEIKLHKIAMRPGKPVIAGKRKKTILLGLPGNPVSSMITARLFLKGLVQKLSGLNPTPPRTWNAKLGTDITTNGDRTHFMRAQISNLDGAYIATPMIKQDSAMLSTLSSSNGLIMREPNQSEAKQGEFCRFIWLE